MKHIESINGRKILKMEAKVFIIPNSLALIKDYLSENARIERSETASKMCKLNNAGRFNPDEDKLVQLWFHSDDVHSDNLCCHGFSILDENGKEQRIDFIEFQSLPTRLFDGKKEGDTFVMKFPYDDIIIEMNLTLDQLNYRYSHHGGFHECLELLKQNS